MKIRRREIVHPECEEYVAKLLDCMAAFSRLTKQPQSLVSIIDDSKAFAFYWTTREASALGKDAKLSWTDPTLAAELLARLNRWHVARLNWYVLLRRKECPDAFDPDEKKARAAELGMLLGDQGENHSKRLFEFIEKRSELSEHEWRTFLKTAVGNQPARWHHPELDTFLILAWPIVESCNWSYADVLEAVTKKFPEGKGHPFEEVADIRNHCRALELRTTNPVRSVRMHRKGRVPLMNLALEISPETDLLRTMHFLAK